MPVDVLDDSDVVARPVGIAPEIDSDAAVHPVDIVLMPDFGKIQCERVFSMRKFCNVEWNNFDI